MTYPQTAPEALDVFASARTLDRHQILSSPDWLPFRREANGRRLAFARIGEATYREAPFLDERILADVRSWGSCTQEALESWLGDSPARIDFIFHIGHTGSTLLSRLLGRAPGVFSVREPAILRPMAGLAASSELSAWLPIVLKLLARTPRTGRRALLKPTSFVSEIGPAMSRLAPDARLLLLHVRPQVYIAGILGGEATREELVRVSPPRAIRLARLLSLPGAFPLSTLSEGELAGLGWIVELLSLAKIAETSGRTLWLDFDDFLAQRQMRVGQILTFLGEPAASAEPILAADDWRRYAKATDFMFDARVRSQSLAAGADRLAGEICRGLAWINDLAARHQRVRTTLEGIARARG